MRSTCMYVYVYNFENYNNIVYKDIFLHVIFCVYLLIFT